jgi:hypothetical protein
MIASQFGQFMVLYWLPRGFAFACSLIIIKRFKVLILKLNAGIVLKLPFLLVVLSVYRKAYVSGRKWSFRG